MKRYISTGIVSVTGLLSIFSFANNKSAKHRLPNIIILYADDLGYGDLSCLNTNSKIPTNFIDNLASSGICFTDGHSSCAVSTPSRYALLTGNYHWRQTNTVAGSFTRPIFDKNELTIADLLKEKGYYTAAIGKWHLGWDWDSVLKPDAKLIKAENGWGDYYDNDMIYWTKPIKGGPVEYGFDYYYGNDCPFHPPYTMIENETVVDIPTEIFFHGTLDAKEGDSEMRNGPMVKNWDPYKVLPSLTDKVVEIIKKSKVDAPFFIYYGIPTPHSPIIPNDKFDGKSEAGAYGDFVVETDYTIGKIMKALKETGADNNTIIIFTSDNGPEVFACERMEKFKHNSSTFRGIKRDIYEGGHRVPFIISWPKVIQAGTVSNEVISQVDLMATFAEIVGYELPDDKAVDSYNLLPVLKGEKCTKPLREATVFNTTKSTFAIRKGEWLYINGYSGSHNGHMNTRPSYKKYFDYVQYSKGENRGLLFNLREDIMEKYNVYLEYPKVIMAMDSLLIQYIESGRSIPHRKSTSDRK